ncbi:hypothetical protein [Sinorhizobium sp. BG8]|uniref:hypothetical protein n=1 Tax=Sinorhizobium sp. BG8 TaxID=2613773 RepID=UPI00193DD529|nr:hypothetical protein [Sinorhizobium sp. BG8]QRM55313.1 hypothetical protein F3Y30_12805 [Sinorhizobium sp. BG8]
MFSLLLESRAKAAFAAMLAFSVSAVPPVATAGPLADAAKKAEELAAAGDPVGAHDLMRDAYGNFSATLPFSIGRTAFVDKPPEGYGMFQPRESNSFRPGEVLMSYVEPVGLTWKPTADGKIESAFTVDLELLGDKGEILAEQKAFGTFNFKGSFRNQEIFANLTLDLDSPPEGTYVLRYRFRDAASGAVAISEQPFQITP